MAEILKKVLNDMKESAKAQHEVCTANFAAAKTEFKAQWEEAKAFPKVLEKERREGQQRQIQDARKRMEAAQKRVDAVKADADETASENGK